jgi:formylglycine-generating enzyme required for sulfatase activity
MVLKRLALIATLTLCCLEGSAFGQNAPSPLQTAKVALVLANGAYQRAPIATAASDATSVAEVLRQSGFDVVYSENAQHTDMQAAIDLFRKKLRHDALAIVYYSGYAIQYQSRNFLVPIDASIEREADVRRETIDVDLILDPMIVTEPLAGAIILDASRPNPWQQIASPRVRGLAVQQSIRGITYVYSTAPGKLSSSTPRVSQTFVSELVKQLTAPGVSFEGILRKLEQSVSHASRGEQVPWHSSLATDFVIRPISNRTARPATEKPADQLEVGFWTTIRDSKKAADFQAYLDSYPDGQFAPLARDRLSNLVMSAPIKPPSEAVTASRRAVAPIKDCSQCPELVLIPAGSFMMGSTELFDFETPVHQVKIVRPFYVGQSEVTYEEWDACVMDGGCQYRPNDRGLGRGSRPVADVDWNDAQTYIAWLSRKTGRTYRLPTESEWEYAARAGTSATYPWGTTFEKEKANCMGCNAAQLNHTTNTGTFPPNAFGLFDMAGNAAQWVEDCWHPNYRGAPSDGSAWVTPQCGERVLRGGSFNNDPRYLRTAARFKYDYDVRFYTNGFRVAREQ